jgi:HAD superfamily hydrolase (TIGR01544 family)
MTLLISNTQEVERKLDQMKKDGLKNLQILTDFDKTLTKAIVDGKPVPSVMGMLRNGNYISPEYAQAATALSNKYHPIEIDLSIPEIERRKAMESWWSEHFALLIRSGLNKKHLEQMVSDSRFQFREGALEMIDYLHKNQVPLVIISSSGLGETIPMLLEKHGRLYNNIHVITNQYRWDKDGRAVGMKGPLIHVMNKDESALKTLPVFSTIAHRRNIILLGDGIGDLKMIGDLDYKTLLNVGFLDENIDANRPIYEKGFDIVLEKYENFSYLNKQLEEIK